MNLGVKELNLSITTLQYELSPFEIVNGSILPNSRKVGLVMSVIYLFWPPYPVYLLFPLFINFPTIET